MGGCGRKARAPIRPPLPNPGRKEAAHCPVAAAAAGEAEAEAAARLGAAFPSALAALCAHRGYLRGHLRSRGLPKLDALHPRACLLTPPLQFASLVTRLFPGLENVGLKKKKKKKAAARPRLPILELCCGRAAPGGACWEKVGLQRFLAPCAFFGHLVEQNSHVSLDTIRFELEEACAGGNASDPPPPVADVPFC